MSDTYPHRELPIDTRENKLPTSEERQEQGFAELKAHLADFNRRALKAANLDELLATEENESAID